MKREIPVFQYDDAWQILARGDRLNGLVIDAGSEEVMLRIEASMSKLKVMGDDDRRFFWIWAQVNKREREWLQVLTAHYNDFHYLILSDNRSKMAVLQNAESIYSNKEKYRWDMAEYLLALEPHVMPYYLVITMFSEHLANMPDLGLLTTSNPWLTALLFLIGRALRFLVWTFLISISCR